jgi:hypothetical protein
MNQPDPQTVFILMVGVLCSYFILSAQSETQTNETRTNDNKRTNRFPSLQHIIDINVFIFGLMNKMDNQISK